MVDPYAILGVSRGADDAAIKKAYRTLAKALHPDRNSDNPKAAERFAQVTAAYDLLMDKDKRARFDRGEIDGEGNPAAPFGFAGQGGYRAGPGQGFEFTSEGVDFEGIFDGLFGSQQGRQSRGGFGGRQSAPVKGANISYQLGVSFEDAARLAPQRITLQDGKTIDLKLPAGLETGTQMRLAGKGQRGAGGVGDAIVTIEVRTHRFFRREGDDVRLDLPISLKEAVLGAKVKVPTVDGPVMLGVPAGATSGKTLRLKGKGFHTKAGARGDQLVTLIVDLPHEEPALKAFVEQWSGDDDRNPRAGLGV